MDGLVLGASSGIAQGLVHELWRTSNAADARWTLTTRRGVELPGSAAAAGRRRLDWRALDALQDPGTFLADVGQDGWRPRLVLVAWGVLVPGETGSLEELARMREINGPATLRWLDALAAWLPAGSETALMPRVAVLGSVAGDRPRRRQWEYSLSKQELEMCLNALRARATGQRWTLVKPGPVATPMTAHMRPGLLMSTPEAIAPAVVKAWLAGQAVVYAPAWWGVVSRALALVPEPLWDYMPF